MSDSLACFIKKYENFVIYTIFAIQISIMFIFTSFHEFSKEKNRYFYNYIGFYFRRFLFKL